MKKITAIGLVFLMSLQCFYNLGVITYFQLNRDYIAEVLCINKEKPITMCYGQCFLQKNLNIQDDAGDHATLPAGKRVDFPIFLISENNYCLTSQALFKQIDPPYSTALSAKHSSVPFHPPALS